MSNLDSIFKSLSNHFNRGSNKLVSNNNYAVYSAGTIHQITIENETVIIGHDTLRLVYTNTDKTASVAFSPAKISVGSYVREVELNLSVMNDGYKNTYNRLHVDGGELFQLSTVYDFDFTILQDILAKYLELLKVMKTSDKLNNDHPQIDEAIKNISEAVALYNKEA